MTRGDTVIQTSTGVQYGRTSGYQDSDVFVSSKGVEDHIYDASVPVTVL